MSNHQTPQSRERAAEKLAQRIKQTTGVSSETAHREAAKIARDADRKNGKG